MMDDRDHETRITLLEHDLCAIKRDITLIRDALIGNGQPGIKLEMDRIKRQQQLIWWAVSGVGSTVMGLLGYTLRGWL